MKQQGDKDGIDNNGKVRRKMRTTMMMAIVIQQQYDEMIDDGKDNIDGNNEVMAIVMRWLKDNKEEQWLWQWDNNGKSNKMTERWIWWPYVYGCLKGREFDCPNLEH